MIPVCEPLITKKEIEYVIDCLKSGWVSSAGKYIEQFEKGWASYCGMKHGVAVSSGTTALQIAVRLLDLKPGDEVIMPTFTIISCAQAVIYCGGKPVLVDIDSRNWQMDVSQIENVITNKTKAIMVVHIYGHPADMDPIIEIAKKNDLMIIEDAAEVHGAEYKGRRCGSFGDISVFSFYANKLITTGEGGMVLTNNDEFAERAKALRNLCFQKSRRFYHDELGYNFRLTNIQAALGVSQMERIGKIIERKREIAHKYNELLKNVSGIELPYEESWAKSIYWVYGIVIKEEMGMNAEQFAKKLLEKGIETRPFFLGMHEQPVFKKMGLFAKERYPVSERLSRQGLYIPSGLTIKNSEIEYICKTIRDVLENK